ncbi:MAG: hypothetical protein PHD15_06135 [Clostridia bacterium]|nr:hypothetical protein [Clostridia bacterium]MDD4387309.1 hypothetical protein [Clostridia bacterium]
MNSKSQHQIRLLIIGIVVVIAIIVVIASISKNKSNVVSEGEQPKNTEINFKQTTDETKVNISEELSKDKEVGDVIIKQSKIVYSNGKTLLTSTVINNGIAKDNLRFKVKFIANDGSIITESIGFIGQIKANETKTISSSITLDTSNSKNIVYELIP